MKFPMAVCPHCAAYYHVGRYKEHTETGAWHVARRKRDSR